MNTKRLLIEGVTDAVGFVGGALLGFWVGRWLDFDIFNAGYSNGSIFGIVLVGLGGGGGLQIARLWRSHQTNSAAQDPEA